MEALGAAHCRTGYPSYPGSSELSTECRAVSGARSIGCSSKKPTRRPAADRRTCRFQGLDQGERKAERSARDAGTCNKKFNTYPGYRITDLLRILTCSAKRRSPHRWTLESPTLSSMAGLIRSGRAKGRAPYIDVPAKRAPKKQTPYRPCESSYGYSTAFGARRSTGTAQEPQRITQSPVRFDGGQR